MVECIFISIEREAQRQEQKIQVQHDMLLSMFLFLDFQKIAHIIDVGAVCF